MFTNRTFKKHAAVTDSVVFDLTGGNPKGFGLFVENQDAAKTVTYYFEDSPDGTTYSRVVFSNGGDSNMFTILAGQAHSVKVTSTAAHIRMRAYGDADIDITLTQFTSTDSGTATLTITAA